MLLRALNVGIFGFVVFAFLTKLNAVTFSFIKYPNGSFVWYGCLFKTADWLVPSNDTSCGRCIENGTELGKNTNNYFMRYRNCSSECPQPTLCSEYKFNFNGTWRSECFACEAGTNDTVVYKAIPMSELCGGQNCKSCALNADLASSISCHQHCRGKPTFCPPHEPLFFGQKICYQSERLHGCHFKKMDAMHLEKLHGKSCEECAKHVGRKSAYVCSHHCGNLPTWHKHVYSGISVEIENEKNVTSSIVQKYDVKLLRCVLPTLGAVLDYEIPNDIRSFINPNSFKNYGLTMNSNMIKNVNTTDDDGGDKR